MKSDMMMRNLEPDWFEANLMADDLMNVDKDYNQFMELNAKNYRAESDEAPWLNALSCNMHDNAFRSTALDM